MSISISGRNADLIQKKNIRLPKIIPNATNRSRIGSVSSWAQIDTMLDFNLGCFSYSWSHINQYIDTIGRYCSIAAGCSFGDMEHPTQWLSSSSFTYDDAFIWADWHASGQKSFISQILPNDPKRGRIRIGNDVWIGARAYIRGGVSIGHGAIIGTNAVVTKDVEPYSIIVGNPGVNKKKRFSDKIIEKLLIVNWWDYDYTDFRGVDIKNIEVAIEKIWKLMERNKIKKFNEFLFIGDLTRD